MKTLLSNLVLTKSHNSGHITRYNNIKKFKYLIFETLEISNTNFLISKLVSSFIVLLIILNVFAVILGTEQILIEPYGNLFNTFELISVIIFTIEYILRIWTCTINEKYKRPFWGRVRYMFTGLSLIDLFAILPFYLPMFITLDLRFLRALRLIRIFRLFKITRYAKAIKTFRIVLIDKREQLLSTLFVISILIIICASILYLLEHEAQPEAFSSIPSSMWWAVVTLTTVGYGDIYPITAAGKLVASVILIFSIGMFAVPAGIIASGFTKEDIKDDIKDDIKEEINKDFNEDIICPHCGRKIIK